ncbi:[LysW]-aminoadipate kinase [Streptomyces sp. NPDC006552]|uniref:[LysW]-aminoadipate kinase n=1 Tax=Streptomyces sp. NPDC006552 TaxID=3157179 RepID=UPI00339FBDB8
MSETIVVKCGGNAAVNAEAVCADLARLSAPGRHLVLAHGGSADIEQLASRLGVESRRLVAPDGISTRHTDSAMLEVVQLALAGSTKPRLLRHLQRHGVQAVGLTGMDGSLLRARRKSALRAVVDGRATIVRDNHTGRITDVNTDLLEDLLHSGWLPVVSPPAMAEDGRPVNTDADRAAAAVAGALRADALVLLTGAPGVLADADDPASALDVCAVPPEGPPAYRGGGMGLKLIAAREALRQGCERVVIADGRAERPVGAALDGAGTRVTIAQSAGAAGVRRELAG